MKKICNRNIIVYILLYTYYNTRRLVPIRLASVCLWKIHLIRGGGDIGRNKFTGARRIITIMYKVRIHRSSLVVCIHTFG